MGIHLLSWLFLIPFYSILVLSSIDTLSVYGQCLDDQRSLLLQMKNNLVFDKATSTKLTKWDQATDCCSWPGGSNSGRVVELDLSHNKLTGNIPNGLGSLTDPKYSDKTWKILEHAIHEIYNHNASGHNFEDLYINAMNMVQHKFGEKLYSGLVGTMTSHLKEISKSIESAQGGLFLEELNRKWADHNKALQMICDILMYMDRTFVPSTRKTPVHQLGLNLWRDNIIHFSKIQTRLLHTLLDLILRERSGEVINRGLMRNIIKMLMESGSSVYQDDFEKPFLEVSAEFYKGESQKFIECCDCGDYLKKAETRLNEEMERVSHYLDAKSTETKITNVVEKEMIQNHMLRLVHMENSGLVNMLLHDRYEDLGRMYNLFRRLPNGLSTIRQVMTSHIRDTTGKQLLTDPERLKDPVQRLLDEKDKYDKIISSAFNNDKTFQNALNSFFTEKILQLGQL